jgi:hypothetical protein
MISGYTLNNASNMAFFTQGMTEAAGVPLDKVMEDVSAATKSSYQFVSKTGLALIKAAVEARRMGTSIQSATKTSDSLLEFTQMLKMKMHHLIL